MTRFHPRVQSTASTRLHEDAPGHAITSPVSAMPSRHTAPTPLSVRPVDPDHKLKCNPGAADQPALGNSPEKRPVEGSRNTALKSSPLVR